MNLTYGYDAQTRLFTVSQGSRVLEADIDGSSLATRYGFIEEVAEFGSAQPALSVNDYEEYASYLYTYVKPPCVPGIRGFLNLDDTWKEPAEYCW